MTRRRKRGPVKADSSARRPRPDPVEVSIESLAAGGDGVGHLPDGRVVFVPFTAPGDRARIELLEERAKFGRGRVLELLVEGASRSQPVCPVFGSCGGCTWQHIDYAAQRDAKAEIVAEALARIGNLPVPEKIRVTASPAEYRYRMRTRVVADAGRVGYRKRRSHALCAVSRCPILLPSVEDRLSELSEASALAASQAGAQHGAVEWELVAGTSDTEAVRATALPALSGDPIHLEVGGDRLRVSPGVFTQSNALLLEDLVTAVQAAAGRGALLVELFAGAGFFTLGLARRFNRVLAVESSRAAVDDLEANLASAGIANVDARCQPVEDALAALPPLEADAVIVLDPPRSGLPEGCARLIARQSGVKRIVYLSCDPATLARDAGLLADANFATTDIEIFDLFPQTPHIETLLTLER